MTPQLRRDTRLHLRQRVGMQQHDGDGVDLCRRKSARDRLELRLVGLGDDRAVMGQSRPRLEDEMARHERLLLLEREAEGVGQLRAADLQDPPVALRDDEAEARALALDDRVQSQRRAVHDELDIRMRHLGALDQRRESELDRAGRILRNAGLLVADKLARPAIVEDEIGEGAADIDADAAEAARGRV